MSKLLSIVCTQFQFIFFLSFSDVYLFNFSSTLLGQFVRQLLCFSVCVCGLEMLLDGVAALGVCLLLLLLLPLFP